MPIIGRKVLFIRKPLFFPAPGSKAATSCGARQEGFRQKPASNPTCFARDMQVLIAEDEPVSSKLLDAYIRSMGYDPITAVNGLEAYELWRERRPRIVLTDWNMPLMNGIDLCRKIREQEMEDYTYIIMITARENSADLIHGFDSGVDDYITKPVNRDELAVRLKASERIFSLQEKDLVIFSMARLAETRNMETGLHLERMQFYCRILSDFLMQSGLYPEMLTRRFIDTLNATCPLHDIGKVGIPDYILLKPAPLNKTEFDIIKTHTVIGHETLQSALSHKPRADYLKMSAEIARSHHERWDGSGYPDGLRGEDIPLAARIVTLADVYDALVSERIYKPAFSHKHAKSLILEEREALFDPVITEAFIACEDRFEAIADTTRIN